MDSNAQAAPESERAQNSAPDAPQRLENGDAQAKTDNRAETKADNPSTGKDKPQASQAANSNSETTVSADDAPQPAATDAPSDAVTVVLSGDVLAAASEPKPAADDVTQTADAADAGTAATPAIVVSTTSAGAVALPVAPLAINEIASPAPDSAGKIATIDSRPAVSAATATSSPDTSAAAATPASASASPALPTDAPEITTVATNPAIDATADQTASITTTKASTPLAVTSETSSVEAELAASAAASAQTVSPVPTTGKAKPSSTALTTPTHVMTSADAEATDAPTTTPSLPGQIADASAPKGAERIEGKHDRIGSSADKADAPVADPKQTNTPVAAAPAEHRAPVAAVHSASLDLNLPPVQTQPPQSFQAQTPNLVVNPAAQLNATLANTPVPVNGLAIDIALRAAGGASRFEIRLDPAELGRIDVRLDVDRHGNVTSHLTVEKPATLDMLRRDAPQLQQALENAGLKTGDSGLQFSLRDQSSGRNDDNGSGRNSQRLIISEDDTVPAQVAGRTYGRTLGSSGGVDIRV